MRKSAPVETMNFDYIIVGAGSAGCVLANRLTASGRHRVLLLEAGGKDNNIWIHIPIGYGKLFKDQRVNWMYQTEPEPELNNRRIFSRIVARINKVDGGLFAEFLQRRAETAGDHFAAPRVRLHVRDDVDFAIGELKLLMPLNNLRCAFQRFFNVRRPVGKNRCAVHLRRNVRQILRRIANR